MEGGSLFYSSSKINYIFSSQSGDITPYLTNNNGNFDKVKREKTIEDAEKEMDIKNLGIILKPNKLFSTIQNPLNSRQFCINFLLLSFSKPQVTYLLGFKQICKLVDIVYEAVRKSILYNQPLNQQKSAFLKLFYSVFAFCFAQNQETKTAKYFAKKSKDIVVMDNDFFLERIYSFLYISTYSYFVEEVDDAIYYGEKAFRISHQRNQNMQQIENLPKENDIHCTNAFFQVRIFLLVKEYRCIMKNILLGKSSPTKLNPNQLGDDYLLLEGIRDLTFSAITTFIKQKKNLYYGDVNITIISALLIKFRMDLLKGVSKKQAIDNYNTMNLFLTTVNQVESWKTRQTFYFIINSIRMQVFYILGNQEETKKFSLICHKFITSNNFALSPFCDTLSMFIVTNFFLYSYHDPNNPTDWVNKTRDCLIFLKENKETTLYLRNIYGVYEKILGKSNYFSDIFFKNRKNSLFMLKYLKNTSDERFASENFAESEDVKYLRKSLALKSKEPLKDIMNIIDKNRCGR